MRICSLASSSKGNCTLVYNDSEILVVDMGITLKDFEEKLNALNLDAENIIGVLLTHEHIDHVRGVCTLSKKYGVQTFCHVDSFSGVLAKTKISSTRLTRFTDMPFELGSFRVESFRVSHDVPCVGYNIFEKSKKISIVTDLGYTTKEIVSRLYESRMVILESNHDEKMVMASTRYPAKLKARILSNKGHLSNLSCAKIVSELARNNVKQILFAHLSEENNTPDLCYNTISDYLKAEGIEPNVHIRMDVAKPDGIGPVFVLK